MRPSRSLRTLSVVCLFAIVLQTARFAVGADAPRGLPRCEPGSVGMDPVPLSQIAARMRKFVDEAEISGAVTLVARRGCVVHLAAVGLADLENKRPMREDSLFAIASMTKPITATALMILQDEGRLTIDDPVSKYLPAFKDVKRDGAALPREITIKDVLTHTSGVVGEQRTERTLSETIDVLVHRPLAFDPGTKWQYSPGLNVCGRIIEVVSKMPFDEFLEQRIFRPLHMADTTFRPSGAQRERLAKLYQRSENDSALMPASHWLVEDWRDRAPNPSGGLYSTALDMSRFYQMVLSGGELEGRRIVSEHAVAQMTQIQTGDLTTGFTPGNRWGLGWCIIREPQGVTAMLSPATYGHGGAFGTQGWVDPKRQMIFVLLIQRLGLKNADGSPLRLALQELAVQAVRD